MKLYLTLSIFLLSVAISNEQQKPRVEKSLRTKQVELTNQVVEASCGQCQFKMEGKSCDLAVKIDGKAYFVDGTGINNHGDAHAKDGFCEKVRKAEVSGRIVDNHFKATSFKLLPETKD